MNKELYDNTYLIPKPILKNINSALVKYPNSEGIKRAKNLLRSGDCTYQNLKRLKNFFETTNQDSPEYFLSGGDDMRSFVNDTLTKQRNEVSKSQEVRRDAGVNSSRDSKIMPQTGIVNLKEGIEYSDDLKKNALGVIFNDGRVLILKRSSYGEQWCPNKWGLVGGGVEEGEEPIDACKREIYEETAIKVDSFIEKVILQRSNESIEHIFIGKYDGEPFDIKLDREHQGYMWVNEEELKLMDARICVPNLHDYIGIAIQKYD